MRRSPLLLAAALTALAASAARTQTGAAIPALAPFDSAITALLAQHKVPGGQLALSRNGKLIYSRGFGLADSAGKAPVQPQSVFRLASLSKPITAIAVMRLVEEGKLGLDKLVFGPTGILTDTPFLAPKDARVHRITVRHLLEHAGGWDRDVSGDYMFMAHSIAQAEGVAPPADVGSVIRHVVKTRDLDFSPGARYAYSNLGYAILGRVIERVSGRAYEEQVRADILFPLGITTLRLGANLATERLPGEVTYYDYPGAPLAKSVYDNTTNVPWPYGGFNLEAMDAHGGWVGSAQDLVRLALAVDGFPTVPDILSSASVAAMTKPSAMFANYALGWAVNSAGNWWHDGSLPGTVTFWVRGANQMNWAILLNTRPANSNALFTAVDRLVWDVIPKISAWPDSAVPAGLAPPISARKQAPRALQADALGRILAPRPSGSAESRRSDGRYFPFLPAGRFPGTAALPRE